MKPSLLWWLSCWAYKRRLVFVARALKAVNFFLFHAVLPYEAEIEKDIILEHYGLGVVVHPNVVIGKRVRIYPHVTLAAENVVGSEYKIYIGDDVMIGVGAAIIGHENRCLLIGGGAKIGANAVVTRDVQPGETVVGIPARPIQRCYEDS